MRQIQGTYHEGCSVINIWRVTPFNAFEMHFKIQDTTGVETGALPNVKIEHNKELFRNTLDLDLGRMAFF